MNPTKARRPRAPRRERKPRCPACGKHAYPNEYAAYGAALRRSRSVGPLRVYACPEGHGWHITKRRTWA